MYRSSECHPQPGLRRVLDAFKITAAEMKAPDLVSSAVPARSCGRAGL